ncbi:MAG TPA: hypothetical protein VIM37_03360 [Candidatus Microsaccharimonas sp.]|jgi:hypothetical protein
MNDETFLNEQVEVIAVFGQNDDNRHQPCRPLKFRRPNGREVEVQELGLRHPFTEGRKTIHIFDVTDGGADYRLEFDSERLIWRLTMEADHYE